VWKERHSVGPVAFAFCVAGWVVFAIVSDAAIRWKAVTAALVVIAYAGRWVFPEAWMAFVILQGILGICFCAYTFGLK
jgi:hypothetical protein